MSDLLSNEITEYRALEIEEMSVLLRELLRGNVTPEYFNGATAAFKRVLHIPTKMAKTREEKQQAAIAVNRAMVLYETKAMRRLIMEDEK